MDFFVSGALFPGKFPESRFRRRGLISKSISRNVRQGQLTSDQRLGGLCEFNFFPAPTDPRGASVRRVRRPSIANPR